jgi:hypothetical protein
LIEVLSACRLWIWTTVVEVLVIFFAIRKSVVIGPGVVLFNVVVDCVVLYILCVGPYFGNTLVFITTFQRGHGYFQAEILVLRLESTISFITQI